MSHTIQCPHCQAVLKSPTPVPAGKNVKCPQCKQFFTTSGPQTEVPPAAAPQSPAANDVFAEDDEMAAAIAKLEVDQNAAAPPAPAPVMPTPTRVDVAPDDDLVEPDEEEKPIPKKPAKKPFAPPKKKRVENEDDKPRSKKKRSDEDDEAEAISAKPRSKAKKADPDDEDERRDEDEDDEPPSKGKKKAKKSGGSMMLLTFLLGGGTLGLLACCGCGIGSYFFFSNPMVGKWEPKVANDALLKWDFGYFGTGTAKSSPVNWVTKKKEEETIYFDYKFKRGDPATLDITVTKVVGTNATVLVKPGQNTKHLKVVFRDGEAVLTDLDRPNASALVLRRPQR